MHVRWARIYSMLARLSSLFVNTQSGNPPRRWIALACLAVLLCIGALSVRDYGIPYDEGIMDALGRDTYNYVFADAPWPENDDWRYHGPLVEFATYTMQKMTVSFEFEYNYQRILIRRLVCFAFFASGVVLLYALAKRHFADWRWALLTAALLVLTPRFFAHGFYNSRDIPQLALFLAGIFTLLRFLERRTWWSALLHGSVAALALSVRMTALLIPAFTILFLAIDLLHNRCTWKDRLPRSAGLLALFFITLAAVTFASWPFLWESPIRHFIEAYQHMSSLATGSTNFLGRTYTRFPWHYIPVWIAITVPVVYSVFFLVGVSVLPWLVIKDVRTWSMQTRDRVLFLLWFFLPIFSIMATGAGIYTEWRHIYFVYPAFLLIAVSGMRWLVHVLASREGYLGKFGPLVVAGFMAAQMLGTGIWMVRNHPFENVYFSRFMPVSTAQRYFDPDYWALSYKQSIEWILGNESRFIIVVFSDENIAMVNAYNLFPITLERIIRTDDKESAQYVLTRSRDIAGDLPLLYESIVDGVRINGVYRGKSFARTYTEEDVAGGE